MDTPESILPRVEDSAPVSKRGRTPANEVGAGDTTVQGAPILLFDGVCNLCNGAVDFVMRRDGGRHLFGSLQSEAARSLLSSAGLNADYLDSLVLVTEHRVLVKSDAALELARHLPFGWRVLAGSVRWIPRGIRDAVYDFIAHRRYTWFGKRKTCRVPAPGESNRFIDADSPIAEQRPAAT